MASGDVIFAATGVTDGSLLDGGEIHQGPHRNAHRDHARRDQDRALAAHPAPGGPEISEV